MQPEQMQTMAVEGATVDFVTFKADGITFYQFDTSRCGPPEPMVNAMAGLRLIDAPDKKLIMINHTSPGGLFSKIAENFDYVEAPLADGNVKVVFSYKALKSEQADLTQTHCDG